VSCPAGEVDAVQDTLSFIDDVLVIPRSREFGEELSALKLDSSWLTRRFWSLELLGLPHPPDEDALLLDADTLTRGPLDDLEAPGIVVASGEGARHLGLGVNRATNAMTTRAPNDTITKTFNAGVVKLAGSILGAELLAQALTVLRKTEWPALVRRQHDQFVLNRLFDGRWVEVGPRNNFLLGHAAMIWARTGVSVSDARLIHYNASPRPWESGPAAGYEDPQQQIAARWWHEAETGTRVCSRL
jgi:lipopolysaccharide biosynthesis glycosyltransferase